jgi:hypothetical protein
VKLLNVGAVVFALQPPRQTKDKSPVVMVSAFAGQALRNNFNSKNNMASFFMLFCPVLSAEDVPLYRRSVVLSLLQSNLKATLPAKYGVVVAPNNFVLVHVGSRRALWA